MAATPRNRGGTNICFDCKKACGKCSWSEIDPETKKPAFKPVEGWTAIRVPYLIGAGSGIDSTYYISKCPEFEPEDDFREYFSVPVVCELCGKGFANGEPKRRSYCYECVPFGYARHKNGRIYKHSWHKKKERSAKHTEEREND